MRTQGLAFSSALVRVFRARCSPTKNNTSVEVRELLQLANLFGAPGFVSLFAVLLEEVLGPGEDLYHQFRGKLLEQVLLEQENWLPQVCGLLCQAAVRLPSRAHSRKLLLRLELPLEILVQIGLSLCDTAHQYWRAEGLRFLRDKISQVSHKNENISTETAHRILYCVRTNEQVFEDYIADTQKLVLSKSSISHKLSPLLKGTEKNRYKTLLPAHLDETHSMTNQLEMANSLAGVMEEHGYSCSSNETVFCSVIAQFGAIDEAAVARVIGMMARTHTGLDDAGMMPSLTAVLGSVGDSGNGNNGHWGVHME